MDRWINMTTKVMELGCEERQEVSLPMREMFSYSNELELAHVRGKKMRR